MLNLSAEQKVILALFVMFLLSKTDEEDLLPYYSDGGQATFVRFLLHEARPELFREATSLERSTFNALVTELTCKGILKDGRYFHQVLEALVSLYPKYVNLTPKEDRSERLDDPKYYAFRNCLGALDGVLIPITLPMVQQQLFRNRKGFIAQNVLAVVNFDLEFLYVLAGWEGSAHDSRVIADAFTKRFSIPDGKYYLADAGYGIQLGLVTPFRAVRYHLKEQATCGLKPANPKELFNLRHASLRNVVERIVGWLKAQFKILTSPSEHNIHSQVQLVYAITMLWNFLRHHNQYEIVLEADKLDLADDPAANETINPPVCGRTRAENARMVALRNRLAEKMWKQYQDYVSRR
ncbi:hypothetical protein MJO29_004623 [Puccinia striiformis f. sp. tritici]|nr:hypothetical protein MJO29_004623 [Puccinia striiformis f. sp. tritici]